MQTHPNTRLLQGLIVVASLCGAGAASADNHYVGLINVVNQSQNGTPQGGTCTNAIPTTVVEDKGIVTIPGGTVSPALTLSGLCRGSGANNGNRRVVNFSTGTLTVVTRNVKMCTKWTDRNNVTTYELLDQGLTNIGVTGTLTGSGGGDNYSVQFSMGTPTAVAVTCASDADLGKLDYTVTRTVTVRRTSPNARTLATANFTFGNVSGTAPEPGSLPLVGAGLLGMAWLVSRRRKPRA